MSKRCRHDGDLNEGPQFPSGSNIVCQEPPCVLSSVPVELYKEHVEQYHEHRCQACGGNLVTERFLGIHQEEMHNPFRKSDSVLQCFEENCFEEFHTQVERIEHLCQEHNYPDKFDFDVVIKGCTFE